MSTVQVTTAKCVKTISGNSPQVMMFPEAASQTYKKGELVYLNAGYVTEISGNTPSLILGMAAEDGKNTSAGTSVAVYVANADNIFEFSKTNASGTGTTTSYGDAGEIFAIYRDTTNSWTTAWRGTTDGGSGRLICLDLSEKDVVGDTGGRILAQVLGNFRQLFSTS